LLNEWLTAPLPCQKSGNEFLHSKLEVRRFIAAFFLRKE
jgi:hypothetical protein